jgi:selenocysteine lyase/cysteine desulfurase
MSLKSFQQSLQCKNIVQVLHDGLIGDGLKIPGLFEDVPLVYADYVASGRALTQVEDYIRDHVLPYYANSHTEASFCGSYITRLRAEARAKIADLTNANVDCSVIFTGSGATAGLNRLVKLFGVDEANRAVIFIGPYEHHSNILPWRESNAQVIEIPEASHGNGPDLISLEKALIQHSDADVKIGSFSAASNVTGLITRPAKITQLLKKHGALSVWDYAGGGPYLPINMSPANGCEIDAIVVSTHKFPGGPGGSGVLIVRNKAVTREIPSWPGGGTVTFVSPWEHSYSSSIAAREEAGTPNVIGDIRAALAFIIKDVITQKFISQREAAVNKTVVEAWSKNPQLNLLGIDNDDRLPIFSFTITRKDGAPFHHQLFTRMLSDVYGIQARGGCACAGPYAHRLLHIDSDMSQSLFNDLQAGKEMLKPGWVRLNFSYLMDDDQVQYIIDSVNDLTERLDTLDDQYNLDPTTARFTMKSDELEIA